MQDVLSFSLENLFPRNEVVNENFVPSKNFFVSDKILVHFLQKEFSEDVWSMMQSRLSKLGKCAASDMDELSLTAERNPPRLVKRDLFGRDVEKIVFHPSYKELLKIAVDAGILSIKWDPKYRAEYKDQVQRMGFSLAFVYGMAESGVSCPLCMTDGAASVLKKYLPASESEPFLERIYTRDVEQLYTGAMFLTEKAGGSDVGANQVSATKMDQSTYLLNGEKWFCSNANAAIKLVLARTDLHIKGTQGLSLFLVENNSRNTNTNSMEYVRLKEKTGVKSMATAEIIFKDTKAKLIGNEGEGFKMMAEMINLSRLWNAVIAMASFRRSLIESYQFLCYRHTFGKRAIEHALVRNKLYELAARYVADFYLTWKTIAMLDKLESGAEEYKSRLRVLTPMVKKQTAATTVYGIRECMELLGGIGYIENGVMPKLMRDSLVLPIWEGTSNMMVLDTLRAHLKSEGLDQLMEQAKEAMSSKAGYEKELEDLNYVLGQLDALEAMDQDTAEYNAKEIFETLTRYIQLGMLIHQEDRESAAWIKPTIHWLRHKLSGKKDIIQPPITTEEIIRMIAWGF
ncbi:acyl-CoA dehydrogenase [Echinicola strongylocentroti]|uniref:Acyl-CoA dehydrogenase n=1 Tax=Echinicola strongylocentroti TaxID=1795355 RepID=A0A2Z4IDH6_9BACT|nr:acyl-CoA dehydrogenase family protein [Echinicola strongylocentroti]AWW28825.1 acyl-CoA dehydrogenase [Echinicola strongylocentroti]